MRSTHILISALLLVAALGQASLIEETADHHYQHDADTESDAPATCEDATEPWVFHHQAGANNFTLVDVDDESDAFLIDYEPEHVNDRIFVRVVGDLTLDLHEVGFDIRDATCGESVFDPNATFYQEPTEADQAEYEAAYAEYEEDLAEWEASQPPASPFELGPGEKTVEADLGGDCGGDQWRFLANQVKDQAFAGQVYLEWTDGSYGYYDSYKDTKAKVAMYATTDHLDVTLVRAVIVVPDVYDGQFMMTHSPCGAVEGTPEPAPEPPEAPQPPQPPAKEPSTGEFTLARAGTYVVVLTLEKGVVETTSEEAGSTADTLLETDPTEPIVMPVDCHQICTMAVSGFSGAFFSE